MLIRFSDVCEASKHQQCLPRSSYAFSLAVLTFIHFSASEAAIAFGSQGYSKSQGKHKSTILFNFLV